MNSIKQSLLFLLISVLIFSCDSSRVYEDHYNFTDASWSHEQACSFKFNIQDTLSMYSVILNVRNQSDYRFSNLYLFVEMQSPSEKYFLDTLQLTLAEPSGKWLGSGVGNLWQIQYPLLDKVRLLESGEYLVKVHHGMRDDTLQGILDIGIRVALTNE